MLAESGLSPDALQRAFGIWDAMRVEVMCGQYLDVVEQARGGGSVERALRVARYKSAKYTVERPWEPDGEEGHFGLAVDDYSHTTAPNRRFADLVMQRLVKALLAGTEIPYTADELEAIAERCTAMESAARKVERTMRKVVAATLLQRRVGEMFDAIITGVNQNGTYARLTHPPAEGRVMRGERVLHQDRLSFRAAAHLRSQAWRAALQPAPQVTH